MSYLHLKTLRLEKQYFLESTYTTGKNQQASKFLFKIVTDFIETVFRKHLKSRCLVLHTQHHIQATKQWAGFKT